MPKSLVQSQFGMNARNYVTSDVHAKGASLARLVELVKPQDHWRVLDVATAAGHTALAIAPHVAHVVASDITPEMLVETRRLVAERGLTNVETAEADAEALPFADVSFDLVTCRIAPHHFADVAAFLSEARRVLRPNGILAVVDNVSPDAETTPGFTIRELKDAAIGYNAFEKIRDPSHHRALTMTEWRELIADMGFEVLAAELAPKTMDFAAWCRTMSVPADTVERLAAMLRDAGSAFGAFIQQRTDGATIGFRLVEAIVIARKAA